ncbi:MAG: GAF domain-containing protein [Acidobacteria bacterium]|nr:GAF domain-containing protein [Acidobacteriota bacterium]
MTHPTDPDELQLLVEDETRVEAVRKTGLLDTPPEEAFDTLTREAVRLTGAPIAFIALVDRDRDFYKSHSGFGEPLASGRQLRGRTFCHHTIARRATLQIDDTRADPVFRHVPTVETLGIAAYLGVPLIDDGGQVIGSLCVVDTRPRSWGPTDRAALEQLVDTAMKEVEARRP